MAPPSSSLIKLETHASCTPPTSAGLKNIKLILPYTKNLTLIQPKLLQMVPYLHLISFIATNLEIKEPKIIWPLRRLHVLHFTMAFLKLIHSTFPSKGSLQILHFSIASLWPLILSFPSPHQSLQAPDFFMVSPKSI